MNEHAIDLVDQTEVGKALTRDLVIVGEPYL